MQLFCRYSVLATGWATEDSGLDSSQEQENFVLSKAYREAVVVTHSASPGLRRSGPRSLHSRPPSVSSSESVSVLLPLHIH